VQRTKVLESLLLVAEEQRGLFTRSQARTLGVSDEDLSRLSGSDLERIEQGIWRVRWFPIDPAEEIRALFLSLDPARQPAERSASPKVFVSGRSAAQLYRVGTLAPHTHEFTLPSGGRSRRQVKLHHAGVEEWRVIDGLPVTTPGRTLADMVRSRSAAPIHLGDVAGDLLDRGHAQPAELELALDDVAAEMGSPDGKAALAGILAEADRRIVTSSPREGSLTEVAR